MLPLRAYASLLCPAVGIWSPAIGGASLIFPHAIDGVLLGGIWNRCEHYGLEYVMKKRYGLNSLSAATRTEIEVVKQSESCTR